MAKSLLQNEKVCYKCGFPLYVDKHHIYGAANRPISEKDGCFIYLCRRCHDRLHLNPKFMATYKARCEEAWLKKYNKTIEDFIARYGRNYL